MLCVAAVSQDRVVVTSRVLERICEYWHQVKRTLCVDNTGESNNSLRAPGVFYRNGLEWIAEKFLQQMDLLGDLHGCCGRNETVAECHVDSGSGNNERSEDSPGV
jgi:hypothetical protein